METILDGSGKGYSAKVDKEGRLHVDSIGTIRESAQAQRGYAYNVNTGVLTLTNAATENGIFYIKNNENTPLIIESFFYLLGASTGGSGDGTITIIRNPSTGTLISGASEITMKKNRNFGSSRDLSADAYKGSTGTTVTNGEDFAITFVGSSSSNRIVVPFSGLTLPKGSSVAVKYTTPSGNTSQKIAIAIACYVEDEIEQF